MTDRAVMDFTDVLAGYCSLNDAITPHPLQKNLYLLTAPSRLDGLRVRPEAFRPCFRRSAAALTTASSTPRQGWAPASGWP